jgi:glucosylceramidase
MKAISTGLLFISFYISTSCSQKTPASNENGDSTLATTNAIETWITRSDSTTLLQKQPGTIPFLKDTNTNPVITIDTSRRFQSIEGFGFTLTGGSAYLINSLPAKNKNELLRELFSKDSNAISISYLRVSIGASDLDSIVFSYDDMPAGETDVSLQHFTLQPDKPNLIPLLKQILAINPGIKILGSPWSPPAWMKDNRSTKGGSLKKEYYPVYANYFVKYVQAMKTEGIVIDAITPQNEPLNPDNNPSLYMEAADQAEFIKNHLGPAFRDAGLATKIILYDHNADRPDYPLTILNDPAAKAFVDGSAFHLYGGDISALSSVHNQHPDKHLYFTEQYTGSNSKFEGDLLWHIKNVIIGSMRNWSRTALEWNLANDPLFNPHTPGGCTTCKGALTIGNGVTRNVAYYIIAHASRFVPPGSYRVDSNTPGGLANVAFLTPEGKMVLIVLNENTSAAAFNIGFNKMQAAVVLPAASIATYIWQPE